jgi:hypothetical protein
MLKKAGVIVAALLFCLSISIPAFSDEGVKETKEEEKKSEIVEGMKQGEFAMLLIKELGAQDQLPTAATTQDAFRFLEKVGAVPQDGWDEEASITKEDLCYMLQISSEDCENATFEELLEKFMKKLAEILWDLGIRVVAPQTISPAGGGGGS